MSSLMMKYFVLKPSGDDDYAKASRAALRAYATQIKQANPDLCNELREWADRELLAIQDIEKDQTNDKKDDNI